MVISLLGGVKSIFRLLKKRFNFIYIPWFFLKRLVIPSTPGLIRLKKVTTVNMYRGCHFTNWIEYRVNNTVSQSSHIADAQGLCTCRFDAVFGFAPEYVVLPARINTDDSLHLVIVRHQVHAGRPGKV